MAASAMPALIDALVAVAKTGLPAISVYDGIGVSDDPGDYLMIGVADPDSRSYSSTGTATQDWASVGAKSRDEEGDISCVAMSWNGDSDVKAARDAAYASVEALATLCRANPSLGVAQVLWTSFGTTVEMDSMQNDHGALTLVQFAIHYRARI